MPEGCTEGRPSTSVQFVREGPGFGGAAAPSQGTLQGASGMIPVLSYHPSRGPMRRARRAFASSPLARFMGRPRAGRRGQSLVELTLIMPVIILILMIGLDFGR